MIVWIVLVRRIRRHLDPHIPASLWGAILGQSPHEAIFLQDTIADMDPVDLIIAFLDVQGAFSNTPWLLLEAVWRRLGLSFYNFASGYIRTRKYTVRTLPPPLPTCGLRGRHEPQGGTHPTRTPHPRPRPNGHPAGQQLTGRDHLLTLPQQPHCPPHKVSCHDQGVCHTPHPRATRTPHASLDNHHPPGGNPGHQP